MTIQTITIGAGTLTLGESGSLMQFASQVTSCKLVPSVDTGDPIDVLSGEQAPGDRSESFTLEGTLLQDLGAAKSTTEWCYEHRGEQHPFVFVPSTAKGRSITGTLTVEAIDIGGGVKTKPTSDFKWAVIGAPTLGTAPAGRMSQVFTDALTGEVAEVR